MWENSLLLKSNRDNELVCLCEVVGGDAVWDINNSLGD